MSLSSSVEINSLINDFTNLYPTLINFKNIGLTEEEIKTIISKFIDVCNL